MRRSRGKRTLTNKSGYFSKKKRPCLPDPREPGSHTSNRRPCATSSSSNLGPSTRNLACMYIKVNISFYVGIWFHIVRIRYHQPSQNLKNLPPDRPPGPIIDDLEQRIGPNPSERSFGKSLLVHCTSKATDDKCDSSWAYLSSYVYHQPRPESPKSAQIDHKTLNRRP